ncbi:uncharacterized protein LOC134537319 [Bacillus rossius redtenbacheri]|uniref:uncharacterized protein LOC134537319 n=1 Tax=Bacillus rossius redtenbacheri TaxID=93214 RepID=UPI002FDD56B6
MALSSGKCTCPVHDPIPTSGWRSVGVMIQSPHKDTMDQAVQTSFDYDDEPTGAGTEMDRSHLERAEYNLLETKNSSFKFQPMYSSPSDQPRFVIEIDGEDFTEHERSQEAHEPASSMEFATQTEIVSVVQWGFDGQRDNGQDLISEPVPTESKFPKVYEDCNYQCEFVFEVEPEDPAELTKISNLAHFDDSLPEKEPVADPHIGLSSSKTERIEAQVMESEISPFEILKVYETHSKKINAILVFEDSQKENTLETVTILENKKIATAESYLLQEESNKGGILMLNEETKEKHEIDKLPEEHITFAKTEPLELKAVPYILSYFLPETHFPELRSRVHVTEIQKIEAHMFLKELAYDEVKEVSRDEDLNIDPRKSQNQIDFSYFVHLTSHTNYNVQYSSLYSKPEDGKEDLFDISQDERKDLDGVYVTSPKDIKTVTSMQYDKVEEKRYFKLGVVLPDVKSDPEKNRAENTFVDMNSNHQVKTDTALPSTSNNERNNFKSDIITAHPKDLNYPNHFLKSEFHLQKEEVQTFKKIMFSQKNIKENRKIRWPGKLVSAPRRDDPGDWCHCKEQCRFVSAVDNTCLCSCEECSARRRRERPLQTSKSQRDKGVQVPSLENMAVQTAPSATVWEPPARPARQEPALLPQLTVSAESTAAARHRPPPHDHGDHGGARAQLQFLMPPREGWGAPRSVPVRDFNVVFMPGADESMEDAPEAQPMGYAHWRRRVRSEMVHQPCQVECHFWMLYIIAAVVLATVLLCLAAWLRESAGDYRSSEFVKGGLFRALVVAACALVILLAFYVMWLGSHVDQLRALRLVVVASVVGLVFFTALGVATLLLGPESPVYAVFLFLLAAVFLAACLHSACARRLAAR